MRVDRVTPRPPPDEFRLTFSRDDGWTIVAALKLYADTQPLAANNEHWKRWTADLDKELRRA
jgi:hypothetical protein